MVINVRNTYQDFFFFNYYSIKVISYTKFQIYLFTVMYMRYRWMPNFAFIQIYTIAMNAVHMAYKSHRKRYTI